ncbi:Por secretion system C-terminal sorting domain-containing protein [Dyadobacter sp. SG02]|uniref:GEVED domain-containing protein n=1 Tax=Dyadobacter sp. SG02 TaxID=1855291 RepID=UPI0008BE0EBF|nr:GEVED domain-containing protein [Dyadobacter sp. SG02]SEI50915.1 Por secretion system C-terminal sorting domain-containing protein [Dyadobacter sp. SG02]
MRKLLPNHILACLLTLCGFFAAGPVLAQFENHIWYFGNSKAGLSFNTVTKVPTALNNKYTPFGAEGCFVATNPNTGELLFYTSGNTIINKNHVPMQNGNLVFPAPAPIVQPNDGPFNTSVNGAQSVAVIEKPNAVANGECGTYFYFINDANEFGSSGKPGSIYVGQIDMNANGGLGAVTQQPVRVFSNRFTESMYVVARPDNQGAWMILNSVISNSIEVYSISAAGAISPTPVSVYAIPGENWAATWGTQNAAKYRQLIGSMAYHPKTGKFAMAQSYGDYYQLYVADFNASTGILSNVSLKENFGAPNIYTAYGLEFSPSGKWLYNSIASNTVGAGAIRAFNMLTNTDLGNINTAGGYSGLLYNGLKAGPDGRLWVNVNNYGTDNANRVLRSNFNIENPVLGNNFNSFPLPVNSFSYRFPDFLSLPQSPDAIDDVASSMINCQQQTTSTQVLSNDISNGAGNLYVERLVRTPEHGTAQVVGGAIEYTLTDLNFAGTDTITYLVRSDASCLAAGSIGTLVIPVTQCPRDYGDAPDSYQTSISANGASHNVVPDLNLGTNAPDIDADGVPDTNANGDNNSGSDDEDGVPLFPEILGGNTAEITNYTVEVSVNNTLAATANLCGWIDWNSNGTFDSGEGSCSTAGPGAKTITLTWPSATLSGGVGTQGVFARFRITTDALTSSNASGVASNGEVEDYFIRFRTPLPVKLIGFDAARHENTALLRWKTTEELASDRFEIERSANGNKWTKIGTVASHGTTTETQQYSFTDMAPLEGQNLYRLKMLDLDRTFAFSKIVYVQFDHNQFAYPNPATEKLEISGSAKVQSIKITDVNGRVVLVKLSEPDTPIDISKLQAGIYIVQIHYTTGSVRSQKIVKK